MAALSFAILLAVGCGGVSTVAPDAAGAAGSGGGTAGAAGGSSATAGSSPDASSSAGSGGSGASGTAGQGVAGAGGSAVVDAGAAGATGGNDAGALGGSGGSDAGADAGFGTTLPPACVMIQKTIDYAHAFAVCTTKASVALGVSFGTMAYQCAVCDPAWLQPRTRFGLCVNAYLCVSSCDETKSDGSALCTPQP